MSAMELDQTALEKADAENAANKTGTEIVDSEGDVSEIDELIDYNELEAKAAAMRAAERVALKEMLTANGHALREILRSEKVKAHYVSPFSERIQCLLKTSFKKFRRKTYMK